VPEPGNPQSLNRYSYALNNPVRYSDPSGHYFESPVDVIFILLDLDFIAIDLIDMAVNGHSAEAQLAYNTDVAALVADVACLAAPGTGGGLAVRTATGVAAAVQVGTKVNQAVRIGKAGAQAARNLWMLAEDASSGQEARDVDWAKQEMDKWGVEDNLSRSDERHLDAVRRERAGEQLSRTEQGHIREVGSARRGLNRALRRINRSLLDPALTPETVSFWLEQQAIIQERIGLIDKVLP
jgi:pyocin large subunit-like protein